MATATLGSITTFESQSGTVNYLLRKFYIDAVAKQLNEEVLCLELMQKSTLQWSGGAIIVPLHLTRNSGVAWAGESNTLPTPSSQAGAQLTVEPKFVYGRFRISGPAMAAAKKNGKGAVLDTLDFEMEKLVDDVKNEVNQNCFSGGRVLGFLNQHSKSLATMTGSNNWWDFSGDKDKVDALRTSSTGTLDIIKVRLRRTDSWESVAQAVISGSTEGAVQLGVGGANSVLDTTAVSGGYAIAVELSSQEAAHSSSLSEQASGIFSNLFQGSLYNLDRSTSGNAAFRGVAFTQATSGDHDRAALSVDRLQAVLDEIHRLSGKDVDIILCNDIMYTEYTSFAQGPAGVNLNVSTDGSQKTLDVASWKNNLAFNGIPIKRSRHCPKGLFVCLNLSTWKLAELAPGEFIKETGSELQAVSNVDDYIGSYRWYFNIYCNQPNANGVLTGVDYQGAVSVTTGLAVVN